MMRRPDLRFTEVSWRRLRKAGLPVQAVYDIVRNPEQVYRRPDGITEYVGVWEGRRVVVFTDRPIEPRLVLNVVVVREIAP